MDTKGLLDQLLKSGSDLLQGTKGERSDTSSSSGSTLDNLMAGMGGGALGAGAIGLLLGNKKVRKLGGKAITYGGLGALGVVAYKAYQTWQQGQAASAQPEPRTVDRVPEPEAERHSGAVLRALIAAAKADGHIDERERQLIDGEIAKLTHDPELRRWFDQELHKSLDPADVARAAETPEMGAEMYLASLLMVDEQNFMERAYLDELARQMDLPPDLKVELERQAAIQTG
ncbi:tellurite resistance TerB family protein [Thiohalomonas denitrificans]|uniref:Uncharacterized membrane protein YebE, DUF533 family n=1 Tax=Thiohalomonas denitrificans TaxID=415747 RepID=A0A1G5QW64_9GAMM|nr:tellurite resistance TerB family protein [Thiohalomonas denitrificans]SCZ65916.1 Uncharacterized membrane protein YebE, DUF533 family [Thiohalomonas denitrificans]